MYFTFKKKLSTETILLYDLFRKIFLIFSAFTGSEINYPSWYWGWKMNLVNFSLFWIFYALRMTCRVVKILSISLNECCNYLRVCQWMSSISTSSVQWLDIEYYESDTRRLTAMGHQTGLVKLAVVDAVKTGLFQPIK